MLYMYTEQFSVFLVDKCRVLAIWLNFCLSPDLIPRVCMVVWEWLVSH
jgi:hypothetical protein